MLGLISFALLLIQKQKEAVGQQGALGCHKKATSSNSRTPCVHPPLSNKPTGISSYSSQLHFVLYLLGVFFALVLGFGLFRVLRAHASKRNKSARALLSDLGRHWRWDQRRHAGSHWLGDSKAAIDLVLNPNSQRPSLFLHGSARMCKLSLRTWRLTGPDHCSIKCGAGLGLHLEQGPVLRDTAHSRCPLRHMIGSGMRSWPNSRVNASAGAVIFRLLRERSQRGRRERGECSK